ncbi:MAG: M28 family peptidase [Candidatus Obscuribacterales bacterium]|nr:M28 family peptidase [Candidatus Obscuribacterales bacterium]
MFLIPGRSYDGPLPPLTDAEIDLSKRLSDHVWLLAGAIGARSLTSAPESLERAGAYIEHIFRSSDYVPQRQEFSVETFSQAQRTVTSDSIRFPTVKHTAFNVIAEKSGASSSSGIVVVGAHYDSVYDCPAANDNGSGVAALLEIARLLRPLVPTKTLRFVAFTNEEPPFFRTEQMGSYQYAKSCNERKEKVAAMICLETIGFYTDAPNSQQYPHAVFDLTFPKTGNFISFVSNLQSASLLRQCVGTFRKSVKFPSEGIAIPEQIKGVDFSDQINFWRFGYSSIMVTDTAFYRYPHYHEAEDTPDKINYDNLARVVSGLASVVGELCER